MSELLHTFCRSQHQFSFPIKDSSCLQHCQHPYGPALSVQHEPHSHSIQELTKSYTEERQLTPELPTYSQQIITCASWFERGFRAPLIPACSQDDLAPTSAPHRCWEEMAATHRSAKNSPSLYWHKEYRSALLSVFVSGVTGSQGRSHTKKAKSLIVFQWFTGKSTSQIHLCGEREGKKKKAPIDSTLYWQSGAKHWDFSLPFWERAVMKYCAVAQISFPSTLLQPRICCAQAWRIEQLWTWNKSMFLRSPSFSGLQNSSERLSGLISRQSRGRTSREEKLKSYWIPEDRLDPGFNCQKHLEGQISDCLIPSGARDINTRPSAKWMQSTAKSDAKEHFEHAWHWCEW